MLVPLTDSLSWRLTIMSTGRLIASVTFAMVSYTTKRNSSEGRDAREKRDGGIFMRPSWTGSLPHLNNRGSLTPQATWTGE